MKRRAALGTLAGALVPAVVRAGRPKIAEFDPANTKIAHRVNARGITDDDILFLKQIGMRWVRAEFGAAETPLEYLRATQKRFEKYGIRIFSGVQSAYRHPDVQLGRPERDRHIEIYRRFLSDCGKLGIPVASYDFHPANTYTTNFVERRGYRTREFNLDDFRGKIEKQAFEREYSAEDIWATYTYFMKAVLPAAEEAGVKLALHPDDPPVAKMNGVAKLFVHYDGYRRAEQISGGSPNWGLTFCAGTWSEGGDKMGKDVFGMIEDFGGRGKIFEVHFRNVSSPLPRFEETFPDDGYMDMAEVMKALRRVKFSGAAEPDHVPQLAGDGSFRRAGTAYIIAYMRALLRRANEEIG
ncbi:MAG: mannonate dehydratase [Acidobacteria bacterium]|nr:mannonate dehydratase [Acidobacteriota bacterium]MBI3281271.1 mannonate dehydratase [Acidobacteriota bacterium]